MGSCSSSDKQEEDHGMDANNDDEDSDNHILGVAEDDEEEQKLDPKDFIAKKLRGKQVTRGPGTIKGQSFTIDDCKASTIFLCDNSAAVTIDDCQDCVFFIAPCESSVFVRNCKNCKIVVACRQFRTRECEGLDVMLYCAAGQPIIEMSSKIRFAGFNYSYFKLGAQFRAARMSVWDTEWSNVFDFTKSCSLKKSSTTVTGKDDSDNKNNHDNEDDGDDDDYGGSKEGKTSNSGEMKGASGAAATAAASKCPSFSLLRNRENNENWSFLPLDITARQLLGGVDVSELIHEITEDELSLECPVPPSWGNRPHPRIIEGKQQQQVSSGSSSSSASLLESSWEVCFMLTSIENEALLGNVREMISDKTSNVLLRRSRTRHLGESAALNLLRNLKKMSGNKKPNHLNKSLVSSGGVYVGLEFIGKSCIEAITRAFGDEVLYVSRNSNDATKAGVSFFDALAAM